MIPVNDTSHIKFKIEFWILIDEAIFLYGSRWYFLCMNAIMAKLILLTDISAMQFKITFQINNYKINGRQYHISGPGWHFLCMGASMAVSKNSIIIMTQRHSQEYSSSECWMQQCCDKENCWLRRELILDHATSRLWYFLTVHWGKETPLLL